MERTRVVINVGVVFDVDSYEEAGRVLDRIDSKLGKVLGERGKHEITGFQTRPCKAAKFAHAIMGYENAAQAMPEPDMAMERRY